MAQKPLIDDVVTFPCEWPPKRPSDQTTLSHWLDRPLQHVQPAHSPSLINASSYAQYRSPLLPVEHSKHEGPSHPTTPCICCSPRLLSDAPSSYSTRRYASIRCSLQQLRCGYPDGIRCTRSAAELHRQVAHDFSTSIQTTVPTSENSRGGPDNVVAKLRVLTNRMGGLYVNIDGTSPWISEPDTSVNKCVQGSQGTGVSLPASFQLDPQMRIPPGMMPHDERIMEFLDYYFMHIHPYVPVLDRQAFVDQWQRARETVSLLLLEAIFACVTRYLGRSEECKRWLALAAEHEDKFWGTPEISTVQAMIILLKAREFVPMAGYFYRSWMSLKLTTVMAIDLGLPNHQHIHGAGKPCRHSRAVCLLYTRIWQTLFVLELIIGGPQGRSDFLIEAETVVSNHATSSTIDDTFEYESSIRQIMLAKAGRITKVTNRWAQFGRRRKFTLWPLVSSMEMQNHDLANWFQDLPKDMHIHYPVDGSLPHIGSDHHLVNVHIYYHLVVIMHHRPQLQANLEMKQPHWNIHLETSIISAIAICKLQEGLLGNFGLPGLEYMVQGINFALYCASTCIMVHLTALACTGMALDSLARNYLTRHIRVMEKCMTSAQPKVKRYIDRLRKAYIYDS